MIHEAPIYVCTFTKKDGSVREMRFVWPKDIPQAWIRARVYSSPPPIDPTDQHIVWDVEAAGKDGTPGGWRIITMSRMIAEPVPTGMTHRFVCEEIPLDPADTAASD